MASNNLFALRLSVTISYYQSLTRGSCHLQEVAAVASNNLFALRGKETSLFDSAKKARALNLDQSVEERLTIQQR